MQTTNCSSDSTGGGVTCQVRAVGADLEHVPLSPGEKNSRVRAAAGHAKAGRSAEALKMYQELLESDPNDCAVLMGLGELCLMLNDAATASQFFRRVSTLDPLNGDASAALARAADRSPAPPPGARVIRPIPFWEKDAAFREIMTGTVPLTLVDPVRCYMLYQFALQAARLDGDVAEIGVYKGGTARLLGMALAGTRKTVHCFDTFEGMPSTDPGKDAHQKGDFSDTSLASVMRNLAGLQNVAFYAGFFPATAPPVASRKFSLAHIDVDIYRSVLDCCEFFYPRMVPGGMMVFDDYGFETCPGAKQGVDEFFRDTRERPWYVPSGQCVVVKL